MLKQVTEKLSSRSTAMVASLILVFVATRLFTAVAASNFPAESDVETAYRKWAVQVVERDRPAYSGVSIEYPPGSLPFVLAPQTISSDRGGYRDAFVALMAVVDVIGFAGLLLLARRRGSLLGPWIWVLGLPILGPLVYLRLDLVPAVATVWAVERADRGGWAGAGAFLGLAIAAKAYAIVLLPLTFLFCPPEKRLRFVLGTGALLTIPFLPFLTILPDVVSSVAGYHAQRGIQIESLWGSILFIARSGDYSRLIVHDFGAHHFFGGAVPELKLVATIATATAIALGAWLAARSKKTGADLAGTSFATITLVVAVASVFSPQFLIWVLALGAVAVCYAGARHERHALALVPLALITRWIYPTLHPGLVVAETFPVIVLWCRNILILLTAVFAVVAEDEGVSDPSTAAAVSPGTP